jgi:acetyl esterase/lipase
VARLRRWPTDTGGVTSRARPLRARSVAAFVAAAGLLAGCSGSVDEAPNVPASHDYLPGLAAFPHLPKGVRSAPVVVMIPGGAWRGADPTGLQPLAAALADRGVAAVPVHIRTAGDGVVFPVPVEDVLCALADGVATARAAGIEPTRVALLGHSSGAHLASVATLDPEQFAPHCEDPLVTADAFVGLAGPYDIRTFADAASALFRVGAAPAEWDVANPVLLASRHPDSPVLLLHGDADEVVPVSYGTDFAAALTTAGHPTTLRVLPGEDHDTIYDARVVGPTIAEWLTSLPQD